MREETNMQGKTNSRERGRHNERAGFSRLIWTLIVAAAVIALAFLYIFKIDKHYPPDQGLVHKPDSFGVTFSTEFADSLGLDWQETYDAIVNDLQAKYIRIPVYWDEIEAVKGTYDFSRYDYMIKEGSQHGVKFVLAVGRRLPRWPECHSPAWLSQESTADAEAATLQTIQTIVERYRGEASVEYWQVENEPYLGTFGVCPPLDENFLKQEVALVRSLDSRPIIITGSGELSSWEREAQLGDIFGSTLYRVAYNPWFGYFSYPWPVLFYQLKAKLAGLTTDRLMIMELQAEPWVANGNMNALTPAEVNQTMSIAQFRANLQYAIDLNFSRTYAWGVEWWYFQKKYGNPQYWQIAQGLFK